MRRLRFWRARPDGQSLADWLNLREPKDRAVRVAIASCIRFLNAGKKGDWPEAARPLFARRVRGRLRHVAGLELVGADNVDGEILRLVRLAQSDNLCRMRECRHCGRWFFAGKNLRRRSCSQACRAAWFAAHRGRQRAAFNNRKWRIENVLLRAVKERIGKLQSLNANKMRLERNRKRQFRLEKELEKIKAQLDAGKGRKTV